MRYPTFKRIFDGTLSGLALLLLAPFLLIIGLLIKLDSTGPVFFKQERIGRNESRFWMYKFRTMHQDTPNDVPTHLFNDSTKHITRVGAFLRKTSLDELPQLVNILKGEMSIVGPRPALWNQEDLIAARRQEGATAAIPGLTGWAQVKGRDELPIDVKARLDGEYVQHMGFWFDLRCIGLTIRNVILREGIVEGAHPPTPTPEEKKMMHVAKK